MLVLIALAIGLFLFCKRRRRTGHVKIGNEEESIPLRQSVGTHDAVISRDNSLKGKQRAVQSDEAIFDVGEDGDEDEDGYHDDDDERRKK